MCIRDRCDIALAVGVTPYIQDLDGFLDNIVPNCKKFYCLFLDESHWINRLRQRFPSLNARAYYWHDTSRFTGVKHRFGTCFLVEIEGDAQ